MSLAAALTWHPLASLAERFAANLAALQMRDPQLADRLATLVIAQPFYIAAEGDRVFLGRCGESGIAPIADPVPAPSAKSLARKVFPSAAVTGPLAVCGLGYGWLWDCVAKLPSRIDVLPGHRPPIYFLTGDIEQLWAVLHVMDWRAMLADRRYPIFAGPDAFEQFRTSLIADPTFPEPRGLIRIDSTLPAVNLDEFLKDLRLAREQHLKTIHRAIEALYATPRGNDWPAKFRSGRLRVLGITSRYTTFLQHSMRDWLSAFERMGHQTRLVIEQHDHLMLGAYGYARGILDFNPDLILIIDHYRAEIGDIAQSVPCVMWVQDQLPNIYCAAAGRAQGPRDYCLGHGRLHLSTRYGYPAERFLSTTVGINDEKYAPAPPSSEEIRKFGCDVSYVSHASATSDKLVEKLLGPKPREEMARLVWDMHDRMVGHFQSGGQVLTDPVLRLHLCASIAQTGFDPGLAQGQAILQHFSGQVNNAIFRQQALEWVAQAGVDLRIYGRGWDTHPRLARYARGEADNQRDLPSIYRASKINLQVITHGAVHQRLMDGLASGAFFLMRYTPGDDLGIPYRALWEFCRRNGIRGEHEMRAALNDEAGSWVARIESLVGHDTASHDMKLFDCLATLADNDFASLATGIWPELYPKVSFKTPADLHEKLGLFLSDEPLRNRIAMEMRSVVNERFSYRSISQRLLRMIGDSLKEQSESKPTAHAIAA